ncbi:MT-A70 family methyltransferase [Mesorhizobium japonicum]|uniref:MT-A70 family methyltransferase n=1 Tax=Mesorhizobium japonicum TaxID=2066070 RepID=UPI003B5A3FF9
MDHTNTSIKREPFALIYADPPWSIQQHGQRGASRKYDLMTTEDIKRMPIADLAADDAVLALWTTSAALPDALEVMRSWSFEYKSTAIWDKYYMGLGHYFRGSHELLLLGVKGKPMVKFHGQLSVFREPRLEHSRKPQEIVQKLERMFDGPYLELFARERPNSLANWSVWGNEIDADITIPGYPVPSDFVQRNPRS